MGLAFGAACLTRLPLGAEGFGCDTDSDCAPGLACVAQICGGSAPIDDEDPTDAGIVWVAPMAAGEAATSVRLDAAEKRVGVRWVARQTGTLATLHLRMRADGATGCPAGTYGSGTGGRARVTTYAVHADGTPNEAIVRAEDEFSPCGRISGGSSAVAMGIPVTRGEELFTVIRNVDANPTANAFSTSFLSSSDGVVGANGRNERDAGATDVFYGLDARELVGYSVNAGGVWQLPGGPTGAKLVPTFLQDYGGARSVGQPYYYASALSGAVVMEYGPAAAPWTLVALGAYLESAGTGEAVLLVDGVEKARVTLSGNGMVRAAITPVLVPAGARVRVTAVSEAGGLSLRKLHADSVWSQLAGLGPSHPFRLVGDETLAAPLYPLPMFEVAP